MVTTEQEQVTTDMACPNCGSDRTTEPAKFQRGNTLCDGCEDELYDREKAMERDYRRQKYHAVSAMIAKSFLRQAARRQAGAMKRWLEDVSVEMGFGGEINKAVMREGDRILKLDNSELLSGGKWKQVVRKVKDGQDKTAATPYEEHSQHGHKMTRHSPDGFQIIEECEDCGSRFLHDPLIGYPVSMRPSWAAGKPETDKSTGARRNIWGEEIPPFGEGQ